MEPEISTNLLQGLILTVELITLKKDKAKSEQKLLFMF